MSRKSVFPLLDMCLYLIVNHDPGFFPLKRTLSCKWQGVYVVSIESEIGLQGKANICALLISPLHIYMHCPSLTSVKVRILLIQFLSESRFKKKVNVFKTKKQDFIKVAIVFSDLRSEEERKGGG